MLTITLRFYEELNDFLPLHYRKVPFQRILPYPTSVKDLIESCGVPHTQVDLILVNGESVAFDYLVSHGDIISVYPVFESLDISPEARLQERPLRHLQFVADTHAGKLARKLRLLGFDVAFDQHATYEDLIRQMLHENRVILTHDRCLLMRKVVTRGFYVRSTDTKDQVLEVIRRFDLAVDIAPLTRCVACNGLLRPVEKQEIEEDLEPGTKEHYQDFTQCRQCKKVYWRGSHSAHLDSFIEWIAREAGQR